jgi:p-aminobenzoyl-glutamate transporter AbgT
VGERHADRIDGWPYRWVFIHILLVIAIVVVPVRVILRAEKTRTLPLPPIVGGISLVGGIVLLVVGKKKG